MSAMATRIMGMRVTIKTMIIMTDHAHHDHHDHTTQDNNRRAPLVHVVADAAISAFVVTGLVLARLFD